MKLAMWYIRRLALIFALAKVCLPQATSSDQKSPNEKPSAVDGIWLGTLSAPGQTLRIQLRVKSGPGEKETCSLDSLDQGAMGLECGHATLHERDFSFDVPAVNGKWDGTLSADGAELHGKWSQGLPLELDFKRQTSAIAAAPVSPPSFDPAMPPVSITDIQSVLDRDLAAALTDGALSPANNAGVVIGVLQHGTRRVFAYGSAAPDGIFEIGSVTKTFTGLILAQVVEQGKVKLDEPVRELLPPGTVPKPDGTEITLVDLATQHSGLPRMPTNFAPADPQNPYADYRAANLYAFLSKSGVSRPAGAPFLYSNVGFGLLGHALSLCAQTTYPDLLAREITIPLELKDTVVTLTPEQQKRFIAGHDAQHHPAHAWDLDALAGAGAIRSTGSDMLKYLEANLHPDAIKASSTAGATLPAALALSHELRADVAPGMRIALAWLYNEKTETYWHNGATGGYSSFALFNPKGDYAAVVLFNTTVSNKGSFADRLGEHISERLNGKPAISLGN